jgi:hypothetical protein
MQNEKTKKRGGKRDGAGRPTLSGGERRVALPARVHPSTLDALKTIAKNNETSVGAVIDGMASDYLLRSQRIIPASATRPRPEDFDGKKGRELAESRRRYVISALSKLFSDGTFEPHEIQHFLYIGHVLTGGVVNKVATDYGKRKGNAIEALLGLGLAALVRATKETIKED